MDARRPLPDAAVRGSHPPGIAATWGVTRAELGGPLWAQSNRGLWTWSATRRTPAERIRRAAPLVRGGGGIGGWAAAFWLGHHDLDGEDGELPVLLCLPRASRCRRTRDLRVFRSDLEPEEILELDHVPITTPARTCADLARLTQPLAEAVVAVDVMARDGAQILDDASSWLTGHPRWVGVARARRVLQLAAPGTKSPQESRLRLLWVLDAGLPPPLVNPQLVHRDGYLLGEVDLFDPESGLVAEYDGGHHASAEQRSIDHARRERLQQAGVRVVQHTTTDLCRTRGRAVIRLRQLYAEGMRRNRRDDLWRVVQP